MNDYILNNGILNLIEDMNEYKEAHSGTPVGFAQLLDALNNYAKENGLNRE